MNRTDLASRLACPDCTNSIQWNQKSPFSGSCTLCGRDFQESDGILSLVPSTEWLPQKEKNEERKKWEIIEKQFVKEYIYQKGTLTERIHDLGHKAIERLRGKDGLEPTLDLGSGYGAHFPFLENDRKEPILALDLSIDALKSSQEMSGSERIGLLIQGDCYRLPFAAHSIGQIYSIYTLEHIADLDRCFSEASRVLKDGGSFYIAIPAEGGLFWNLGRSLTTARVARKKYGVDYHAIIKEEHVSQASLILEKLSQYFAVRKKHYYPFRVPSIHLNLIIVLQATKPRIGNV